jgi:hypothetical protein
LKGFDKGGDLPKSQEARHFGISAQGGNKVARQHLRWRASGEISQNRVFPKSQVARRLNIHVEIFKIDLKMKSSLTNFFLLNFRLIMYIESGWEMIGCSMAPDSMYVI